MVPSPSQAFIRLRLVVRTKLRSSVRFIPELYHGGYRLARVIYYPPTLAPRKRGENPKRLAVLFLSAGAPLDFLPLYGKFFR
jgi:hypothetical protein